MSRHLIAYEGRISKDGRLVQFGALQWDPDKKLPIIGDWMTKQGQYQIGRSIATINRIERISDELWAEVWPEVVDAEHCLTLDVADGDIEVRGDSLVIFHSARILGAHLSPINSWIWDTQP